MTWIDPGMKCAPDMKPTFSADYLTASFETFFLPIEFFPHIILVRRVMRAVKILTDPRAGVRLKASRVTVSTVGLVPEIERFCGDPANGANLAISLHAVTNEVRDKVRSATSIQVCRLKSRNNIGTWYSEKAVSACRNFAVLF